MNRYVWENLFSIGLPERWVVEEPGDRLVMCDAESGVGAITLEVHRRTSLPLLDPFVMLAHELRQCGLANASGRHGLAEDGQTVWLEVSGRDEASDRFVRILVFDDGTRIVRLAYNCEWSDRALEAGAVDGLFLSFRWEDLSEPEMESES